MIGIFFEDINYGLDGGLNAQMIENRHFEMLRADSEGFGKYSTTFDGLYGWSSKSDALTMFISKDDCVASENPHYLVATSIEDNVSFVNKAYDGIFLKKDMEYELSFYGRSAENAQVKISVCDKDGEALSWSVDVEGNEWKEYKVVTKALRATQKAEFTVTIVKPSTVMFDFFSMKPMDAVMGIFRKDLAKLLKDLKPEFLRFPGGCVVEGATLDNRYYWKRTVGEVMHRPFNWSRWAVHVSWLEPEIGPYHYYGQSYEVGFYEYFLLCEYLKCKPVPVVGVGLACQYQTLEKIDLDDPVLNDYIQDAIDLIEFANGDVTTKWGALRAKMGHEKPFNMDMIGIGNEQWEDENSQFFERYRRFEAVIHKAYPDIKCIGTAGPDVTSEHYTDSWKFIREESKDKKNFVYAVDEHYYVHPEWLLSNNKFYDEYPRDIKVFAGEYACHLPHANGRFNREDANTFYAGLCEAAFITGLERNADVVVMASYAPLLSRIGYSQWSPNMIWFDGDTSYATPSYYVQKLFSVNKGEIIKEFERPSEEGLFASAVKNADGKIVIKAVNVSDKACKLDIGKLDIKADEVKRTVYAAGKDDCNSIENPEKCVPVEDKVSLQTALNLAPLSLTVIVC